VRSLPGCPDLVFRSRRKVLLVHGCFWHQHTCQRYKQPKSNVSFWSEKLAANVSRDKRSRDDLRRMGWKVGVVWECQLRESDRLKRRLDNFLR
jgi:DNA mismatch endonuclease (patch repair protein)